MPIANLTKFFEAQGKTIRYLRASTLGTYWYCAVVSWLQSQGVESPSNEPMRIGKHVHNEVAEARTLSKWENEFKDFIMKYQVQSKVGEGSSGLQSEEDMVFQRAWYDGETVIGHVVTHGMDDFRCYPDRTVVSVEYKITAQRVIDYYKLSPAIFQKKAEMWILEPILELGGYKWLHGEVVFLTRKGDALGKHTFIFEPKEVEFEINRILAQFRDPSQLIPPSKYKCFRCPDVFKSKCPFQKGEGNAEKQA